PVRQAVVAQSCEETSRVSALLRVADFFFFSSRRRHTRFKCDWSSDVCSSDLAALRERILRKTRDVLEPEGAFLVYQFSTRVLEDLRRFFGYVGRRFEPLNVLPAHLFICQSATA